MNSKTRYQEIDILKGLCIIFVVIGHYYPENSPGWYINLRSILYSFHMPAFMFASGFLYTATYKKKNYIEFISGKFKRLMIPYYFTSIIILGIKYLTQKKIYVQNPIDKTAIFEIFYLPVAGYFLWFMFALFTIFLIIPFFNTKIKQNILLIAAIILYFIPFDITDIFCINQVKSMLVFFVLGMVWNEITKSNNINNFLSCIFSIVLFCLLTIIKFIYYIENSIVSKTLSIIIALSAIYILYYVSTSLLQKDIKIKFYLLNIGITSFTIYLLHTIFMGFTKAIIKKIPSIGINYDLSFCITAIIIVCAGIAIPFYINKKIIHKFRITQFIFGIKTHSKKTIL